MKRFYNKIFCKGRWELEFSWDWTRFALGFALDVEVKSFDLELGFFNINLIRW